MTKREAVWQSELRSSVVLQLVITRLVLTGSDELLTVNRAYETRLLAPETIPGVLPR